MTHDESNGMPKLDQNGLSQINQNKADLIEPTLFI
jgi:hypothetical protein